MIFDYFYYLDYTKCKFPDFSQYSFFSPDLQQNSLTFAKSGISLTFPWPLDTLYCDGDGDDDEMILRWLIWVEIYMTQKTQLQY